MCGFCQEGLAIEIVDALAVGNGLPDHVMRGYLTRLFYLQECESLLDALAFCAPKIEKSIADFVGLSLDDEREFWNQTEPWILLNAVCGRVGMMLFQFGFSSPEYQEVIQNPLVIDAIDQIDQYESEFHPILFSKDSLFRSVNYRQLFLHPTALLDFVNHPSFFDHAADLFNRYIAWWREGFVLEAPDAPDDHDNFMEEMSVYYDSYPYVILSFAAVVHLQPTHELITKFVMTEGLGMPQNLTLWMQRQAAIVLHHHKGIEVLTLYKSLNQSYYGLSRVRPALLYYLLVKQCLSTEEKEELYVAALSSGLDHMYIRKKIEPPLFAYVSRFTAKLIVHYLSDVEW